MTYQSISATKNLDVKDKIKKKLQGKCLECDSKLPTHTLDCPDFYWSIDNQYTVIDNNIQKIDTIIANIISEYSVVNSTSEDDGSISYTLTLKE